MKPLRSRFPFPRPLTAFAFLFGVFWAYAILWIFWKAVLWNSPWTRAATIVGLAFTLLLGLRKLSSTGTRARPLTRESAVLLLPAVLWCVSWWSLGAWLMWAKPDLGYSPKQFFMRGWVGFFVIGIGFLPIVGAFDRSKKLVAKSTNERALQHEQARWRNLFKSTLLGVFGAGLILLIGVLPLLLMPIGPAALGIAALGVLPLLILFFFLFTYQRRDERRAAERQSHRLSRLGQRMNRGLAQPAVSPVPGHIGRGHIGRGHIGREHIGQDEPVVTRRRRPFATAGAAVLTALFLAGGFYFLQPQWSPKAKSGGLLMLCFAGAIVLIHLDRGSHDNPRRRQELEAKRRWRLEKRLRAGRSVRQDSE